MTNSHRRPPACPRCGSNNTQTFEIAYLNSVRDSVSGYVSVSNLGKSIAPPEPRSVVGAALFTGAGLGSGAMLLLSSILSPSEGWPDLQVALLDWRILLPSLLPSQQPSYRLPSTPSITTLSGRPVTMPGEPSASAAHVAADSVPQKLPAPRTHERVEYRSLV